MKNLFEICGIDFNEKVVETKSTKTKKTTDKTTEKVVNNDKNKKLENELKNYTKIQVKIWGSQVFVIEDQAEIEAINLNDLKEKLIQMGFEEFRGSDNIIWNSIPNETKTETILLAAIKFHAKG